MNVPLDRELDTFQDVEFYLDEAEQIEHIELEISHAAIENDTPPRCNYKWPKFWTLLDFIINDLLVVIFSIADIVLDILVCIQFYKEKRMGFFYISVAIFCIAQLTYGFLFAAAWGRKLSPAGKTATFFLVLPFGQFVPFFTWIEAFRFEWLDKTITAIGLEPTAAVDTGEDEGEGDMLWSYIQRKYQSHAGFLAESLAEAIPQCVLQTIAVITAKQASPVFIVSIVISICVISSKGYLVSYSIHRPTFVFNFLCIVADCFNLFATCAWFFQGGMEGVAASLLDKVWIALFALGCCFLVLGGLCLVVFSMFDDHLKLRHHTIWGDIQVHGPVWFSIYLVRSIAWVLAIIPVCVIYLTCKLSLVPIFLCKSLDPEHAQHWSFYSSLYRFMSLHLTDLRIQTTNKFILQCRRDVRFLTGALQKWGVVHDPGGRVRTLAERRPIEKQELERWLSTVGNGSRVEAVRVSRQVVVPQAAAPAPDAAEAEARLLEALAAMQDASAARAAVRHSALLSALGLSKLQSELTSRSAIFMTLFSASPAEASEGEREGDRLVRDRVMFYSGMTFMWIGLVSAALWTPTFIACALYGGLYPVIQLGVHLSRPGEEGLLATSSLLQHALSLVYICLLLVLLSLLPLVYRFQLFRTDLVDMKNFPRAFYDPCVVRELHRRFNAEVDRRAFERFLDIKLGDDMIRYIKGYVDNYDSVFIR